MANKMTHKKYIKVQVPYNVYDTIVSEVNRMESDKRRKESKAGRVTIADAICSITNEWTEFKNIQSQK